MGTPKGTPDLVADGQNVSQAVEEGYYDNTSKAIDTKSDSRCLSQGDAPRQNKKMAAALGLEPRTPRSRIWCATNCTTRQV